MKNIYRVFFALWYLLGWVLHVFLGIWLPQAYQSFSHTILFPVFQSAWYDLVLPNIQFFALLLAAYEFLVGFLLISKGKWVKVGAALSLTFNLFLVVLGLGAPAESAGLDFVRNRLPNLVFVVGQIPLLWLQFDRSIPEVIRDKFRRPVVGYQARQV